MKSADQNNLSEIRELLEQAHPKLLLIVADADFFCRTNFKKHFLITSVIRPKTNDSGVHAAGRACDGRTRDPVTGSWYLTEDEQITLCKYLNQKYPYGGGKLTSMAHNRGAKIIRPTLDRPIYVSPNSTAPHIHIQVPA